MLEPFGITHKSAVTNFNFSKLKESVNHLGDEVETVRVQKPMIGSASLRGFTHTYELYTPICVWSLQIYRRRNVCL